MAVPWEGSNCTLVGVWVVAMGSPACSAIFFRDTDPAWAFLEGLLLHAPVGIAFYDLQYRYLFVNVVFATRTGTSRAEHAGRHVRDVEPGDAANIEHMLARVLTSGKPVSTSTPGNVVDYYPVRIGLETIGIGAVYTPAPSPSVPDDNCVEAFTREREGRARAEELNRSNDEFLAILSHELRAPLNAITGWAHLLREDRADRVDRSRALDTILRNAKRQSALIEDLLDVSRIRTGKLTLHLERASVAKIVAAAVEGARPIAVAKTAVLDVIVDPDAGDVLADPQRLEQVMANLLANALKFTPPGGRVVVTVARLGREVVLEVRDNGTGIKKDLLPHIFERFRQGDTSSTRAKGGLGLGLAIVRHLVEAHAGTVHASSDGEGRGATFTVTLSGAASDVESGIDPPVQRAIATKGALEGVYILIVDDDPDARELLAEIVTTAGARALVAASAEEALGLLQSRRADVIVCDVGMPERDGYSFLRELRASGEEFGAWTPAIALTGYASASDSQAALLAGFQLHLPKPVDPPALLDGLVKLWRRGSRDHKS